MKAWFEQSFGKDYLTVYKHRDLLGAQQEVKGMMDWLQLPAGANVLDLCCGMGRHSLALAELGYNVTGMDLSEVLLAEAEAMDSAGQVTWIRGDMREVPLEGPYDALVNLFTSFGYFNEDEENSKVIKEIGRLLKPGGLFIIDFLNASWVEAHLVPESLRSDGDIHILEQRVVEEGFVKKKITLHEAGAEPRVYYEQVKLYGLPDMIKFCEDYGLTIDRVYGEYSAEEYKADTSSRLIMVGHKQVNGDG
ncbi:SAM-dependent methyltransferase [Paenibacillus swuensis]|uniref:SAM-dependent methyltransferase n=1 Tax=Paenibacillus swuensis TaxID=1178515 RepID=A0A172TJN5_9BACL|nr:class I SAM-dependent methyltransferase [Paenibacillus swuensis]ANE47124.1 SAM-dependent methyltransferase [Paenibacillus swuensis]